MTNRVSRIAIICSLEETIRDEVRKMCDTDSLAELDTMALHAKENIENLRSVKYKTLVKESIEVVKDLVEADRKTEPSNSEIPNNFDKDINVRSKTEPQTDIHDLTDCDFCKDRNCKDCEGGKDEPQIIDWGKRKPCTLELFDDDGNYIEPKDKPQTENPCDWCVCDDGKHLMYCMNCKGIAWKTEPTKIGDEPQTERSACDTCQWYNSGIPCGVEPSVCKREVEDEPQTDCAWQNDEHIPTDLASTMLKNRFKEQK